MRTVTSPEPGVIEVNWMWLPTFIGLNKTLLEQLEGEVGKHMIGKDLTEEALDEANELVVDFLVRMNPAIEGLREYLDGLKFVQFVDSDGRATKERSTQPAP